MMKLRVLLCLIRLMAVVIPDQVSTRSGSGVMAGIVPEIPPPTIKVPVLLNSLSTWGVPVSVVLEPGILAAVFCAMNQVEDLLLVGSKDESRVLLYNNAVGSPVLASQPRTCATMLSGEASCLAIFSIPVEFA